MGWLATAHGWLPTRHLPTKNLGCRSPNSLPLSTQSVGRALAQRKLKDIRMLSRSVNRWRGPNAPTGRETALATHETQETG